MAELSSLFENEAGLAASEVESTDRILYTPSNFAGESLLHLQEIGSLKARKPHRAAREHLASYLFFMVTDGKGKLHYEGREYCLEAGDCVFLDCRKPYAHTTDEELWSLSWIHFDGPNLDRIYDKYKERGGGVAFRPEKEEEQRAFAELYEALFAVAKGNSYVRDMLINEKLAELLTQLMANSWHPDARRPGLKRSGIAPIKEYLDLHYTEKILLDDLAERFYIGKFYLTRVFREYYDVSIQNYLLNLRITRAKHLLRFTDMSVEEVGYACGLGAPTYFSRTFKKVEGMSPREFRSRW